MRSACSGVVHVVTCSVVGVLRSMPRYYRLVAEMSTVDLWTDAVHDWRRPVVLPTLPVVRFPGRSTVVGMDTIPDSERRDRLAFAIRTAMNGRTADQIAQRMEPSRSRETIARWARGQTVPSALDVGPLARALGVKPGMLVDPPEIPAYPLAEYLVLDGLESAGAEGLRRGRQAPGTPAPSPVRPPRAAGAGHG